MRFDYYNKKFVVFITAAVLACSCFGVYRGVVIAQNLHTTTSSHHGHVHKHDGAAADHVVMNLEHTDQGKSLDGEPIGANSDTISPALWKRLKSIMTDPSKKPMRDRVLKNMQKGGFLNQIEKKHEPGKLTAESKSVLPQYSALDHSPLRHTNLRRESTAFDRTLLAAHHHRLLQQATWDQIGEDIDGEAGGDQSGQSVSLSADGNRLAIGAEKNDGTGSDSGHVRVFDWNSTHWVQLGLDIDGEASGDRSGHSISLSADGNRLAIGANRNDGTGNDSGHVRVFAWNGAQWIQLGLDINGEAAGDLSGVSVSLSKNDGNLLAIGANFNDGASGSNSGHVRVFSWNGSNWIQLGEDIDGEAANNESGYSIFLSADGARLAIGAPQGRGYVQVFDWNNTHWIQLGQNIDGEAIGDGSGNSVSMSDDGNRLAIGAQSNDGTSGSTANSGHVRVFDWNSTAWVQLGEDFDGEAAYDYSGYSISLSGDGNRLAIGAPSNDGDGGSLSLSGHVRVFDWNGASWDQLLQDIQGDAASDQSGISVSLSNDGKRLAIGAYGNDDGGTDSGHVRVYNVPSAPTSAPMPAVQYFDFDVEVDQVNISLTDATNFAEAIILQYNYSGPKDSQVDSVSFTYDIYEDDCDVPFALHGNTTQGLYLTGFDESIPDKVTAKLGMNLSTIEDSPAVWMHPNDDETQATLSFCGRWNIWVDNVLFQFHESNVTAAINLKEDGGFDVVDVNVGLDRKNANVNNKNIDIEFPVNVTFCDDTADPVAAPMELNQGKPIQFCIQLATPTTGVYVQSIDFLNYTATKVTGENPVTLINGGTSQFGATASVDCEQKAGVCRIKFVPKATLFRNDVDNALVVVGLAVVAFGTDTSRQRRQLAFSQDSSGSTRNLMGHLEDDDEEGQQLTPFQFSVESLQPSEEKKSLRSEHGMLVFAVMGGFAVVVVIAGVIAFFKCRHQTTSSKDEEDAAETSQDVSSADSYHDQMNESEDKYESVEV